MSVAGSSALCFGKLPSHADFVRFNAGGPELHALDEWLQRGLSFARTRTGWEQDFERSPQYRFFFHPENADHFLTGVLQASQDKSHRHYPFLVALSMDRRCFLDSQLWLAPFVLSEFYDRAQQLVRRAEGGMEMREIADQTQALNGPLPDQGSAESRYRADYLDVLPAESFWRELFGSFGDSRKYLVLKNLADVLLPFRGRTSARINLGLRFPLANSGSPVECSVCFWLNLSFILLGSLPGRPFLFWSLPRETLPGYLFLFFRQPSARHFLQLLKPEADNETICAVDEEGREKAATASQLIVPGYRVPLEAGKEPLSRFLSSVMSATT
jgi:type VI secretion system protein ImpM